MDTRYVHVPDPWFSLLFTHPTSAHNQFYAPRPTFATHVYPPEVERPATFLPISISTDPSTIDKFKKEERTGIGYRTVTRTPSPTPSETKALSGKTRTCDLKKYLSAEFYKSPRNVCKFAMYTRSLLHCGALTLELTRLQSFSYFAGDAARHWGPHHIRGT